MRDLKDYINDSLHEKLWVCKHPWEADYETFLEKNKLDESEESYQLYIKESFYQRNYGGIVDDIIGIDPYGQYQSHVCVNETLLHSWDVHVLMSKLSEEYDIKDIKYVNPKRETTSCSFILNVCESIKQLDEDEKFRKFWQLMYLYNYYVMSFNINKKDDNINKENNNIYGEVMIDPYKPKEVTDYVYNTCKGIIYHVTSRQAWEKIKKGEIKPKEKFYADQHKYIYRDGRAFFIASDDFKNVKNELRSIKNLAKINDPVYIKIDLNDYHNKLKFRLDSTGTGYKIFTEEPIPGFVCQEIKI